VTDPIVREFTDREGLRWTARRFEPTLGAPMSDAHARGWLTFEAVKTGERRRLLPAPADWETCSEARLLAYFAAARRVPPRPKSGPLP